MQNHFVLFYASTDMVPAPKPFFVSLETPVAFGIDDPIIILVVDNLLLLTSPREKLVNRFLSRSIDRHTDTIVFVVADTFPYKDIRFHVINSDSQRYLRYRTRHRACVR